MHLFCMATFVLIRQLTTIPARRIGADVDGGLVLSGRSPAFAQSTSWGRSTEKERYPVPAELPLFSRIESGEEVEVSKGRTVLHGRQRAVCYAAPGATRRIAAGGRAASSSMQSASAHITSPRRQDHLQAVRFGAAYQWGRE
jgi:hypothetical protein